MRGTVEESEEVKAGRALLKAARAYTAQLIVDDSIWDEEMKDKITLLQFKAVEYAKSLGYELKKSKK